MKLPLHKITNIEFKCKNCNTTITYDIEKKKKLTDHCYHCNELFVSDSYDDPVQQLHKMLKIFSEIKNLEVSLIAKEENEKHRAF